MLRANTGVVQAGGDGINRQRITFTILQVITFETVNRAFAAKGQGGSVFVGIQAFARRFNTDQFHIVVIEKSSKQADGIGATTDAGGNDVGQFSLFFQKLFPCFTANDALEIAHHFWKRVRADHRTDGVKRIDRVF